MYSKIIKDKAFEIRRAGKSYREIKDVLSIPKSTLSVWFGKELGVPAYSKKWFQHLADIRPLAAKMKTKIRMDELKKIKIRMEKEVLLYPLHEINFQKSLLAMLYWAEGSKHEKMSGLKFTNTDPQLIDLFISLLRNCYKLDESKFRVFLQLHYYHPIRKTRQFWSKLADVPETQFHSVIIKKRSKKKRFRKNFMGICSLCYASSDIRKEMLAIGCAIQGQLGKYKII